jgi:glycosyltransferase involved in cell wall biosynthesis
MTYDKPEISVLLPAYNAERWILEAVRSIQAQTFANWELVVVDDGSTDGTQRVLNSIREPRMRVIVHDRNRGLVPALNTGLEQCRGRWLARRDADDTCDPSRLDEQRNFLLANPEVGVVSSWVTQTRADGAHWVLELPTVHEAILWRQLFSYGMVHAGVLMERALFDRTGLYEAAAEHVEDVELYLRLSRETRFANIPKPLYKQRLHSISVCGRFANEQKERCRPIAAQMLSEWCGLGDDARNAVKLLDRARDEATLADEEVHDLVEWVVALGMRFAEKNKPGAEASEEIAGDMAQRVLAIVERSVRRKPGFAVRRIWWRAAGLWNMRSVGGGER